MHIAHDLTTSLERKLASKFQSMPVNRISFGGQGAQTWHLSGFCLEGTIPVRRTLA